MAGVSGINPVTLTIPTSGLQIPAIGVGQVVQSVLQTTGNDLLLQIGNQPVQIPNLPGFQAGQLVNAEVLQTQPTFQLRLTPASLAGAPPQTTATQAAANLVPTLDILGGATPILVSVVGQTGQAVALRPGQQLEGVIQQTDQGFALLAEDVVLPIDQIEGLAAAQRVSATVVQTARGYQLLLTPLSVRVTPPPEEQPNLAAIITRVLQSLDRLESAGPAVHLIPDGLPRTESTVRLVLSLFLSRGTSGDDMERISSLVRQAADAGALPRDTARAFATLAAQHSAAENDAIPEVLRQLSSRAQNPVEARLHAAVLNSQLDALVQKLADDLRAQLPHLRNDDLFTSFLRRSGNLADFDAAASRVMDRLSAGHMQNVRGLDGPYLFFEVPFAPGSGIRQAQIHIFGDGGKRGNRFDPKNSSIVIDLSTTRLGDLWISLNVANGVCACTLRARDTATVSALTAAAPDLRRRLEAAGYGGAQVLATLWDGNRVQEAAALFRNHSGISMQA